MVKNGNARNIMRIESFCCTCPIYLLMVGIIALPLLSLEAKAADTMCPAFIEAQRSVKVLPAGWAAIIKEEHIPLHHIEIFDGPVEEMASLIPDLEKDTYAAWKLGAYKRGIWLGCFYDGAVIKLSKRLPDNLSECKVTYNPALRVAPGARQILRVECR